MPEVKPDNFDQPDWLRDWGQHLHQSLNALADGTRTYRVEVRNASDGHAARVIIHRTEHGTPSQKFLPREFFESAEYQRIADLGRTLAGLIGEGAFVMRGEDRLEVGSFKEAMKWLLEQARKGQSIQRYKGLGEMNPEQLWDTTINPESRRLLRVKIDDAVTADDVFTTLMGDQVEPRREFIEKNALSVANLDVLLFRRRVTGWLRCARCPAWAPIGVHPRTVVVLPKSHRRGRKRLSKPGPGSTTGSLRSTRQHGTVSARAAAYINCFANSHDTASTLRPPVALAP